MPSITKSSIESLKSQLNLVDVISSYVQLKQRGKSWSGLSPFTQEKTPSFFVHPDKGFFKCFSTGEGGDCYSFIMKLENLEFYEAVEFLSQKFNIPIDYVSNTQSSGQNSLRKKILEIQYISCEWFHSAFMKSNEAEAVRNYWMNERKFSIDIAKQFKIGYAPRNPNILASMLEKKGFELEALKASGLFFFNEKDNKINNLKSRFRGRLMIPIRDINSRVVAFTARQLEQTPQNDPTHKAKYVNSPETLLFHKSKLLFGMDYARKHVQDSSNFIIVEGQLDAIRFWSKGIKTAVAPQGTSITEEQLILLRRYQPSKIECILDGDDAGKKAALRTLPLSFKIGIELTYLPLPSNIDPDELLRDKGESGLSQLRANSLGPIELFFNTYLPKLKSSSTQDKLKATNQLFELIIHSNSEIAQEDYLKKASKITEISHQSLINDFKNFKDRRFKQSSFTTTIGKNAPSENKKIKHLPLTQTNWELLYLIVNFPQY